MRWSFVYIFILLSISARANFEPDTLVLDGRGIHNWTLPYCLCGEGDKVEDIQKWRPCQLKERVDLRKTFWIKAELFNEDTLEHYYLNNWNKDWYEVWLIQGNDTTKTYGGKFMSASKRSLSHDGHYSPFSIKSGKHATLYIKTKAAPGLWLFWVKDRFHESHFHIYKPIYRNLAVSERNNSRLAGSSFHYFTLGGILIFFFFALAMYGRLRDVSFLNYAWYLIFLIVYGLLSNANSTDLFEIGEYIPFIRHHVNVCIYWLAFFAWLRFVKGLTDIDKEHPKFYRRIYYFSLIMCSLAVLAYAYLLITHDMFLGIWLESFFNLILLITIFPVFYLFFFKSCSQWRNYIRWAMGIMLFWGIMAFLKFRVIDFSNLPYLLNIFFTVQTGSFIDTCIFTFAMATKIRRDQDEKLLLQQKYFETERMAIQARLNPHFLFNSLNAARNLIETNQNKDAKDYVLKLSTYLRQVLKINSSNFHSLEDELEFARSYMEIETIRLGQRLEFTIDCSEEVQTGDIRFPPLATQPILENAVWHGSVPERRIHLSVTEVNNKSWLLEICDNLGGLQEGQLESALDPKSSNSGLKLFKNKIDLFNRESSFHVNWHTHPNQMGGVCFVLSIKYIE
ncbi:sensor histidine kinase [Jiulongibacter sp. NS-SX5]|uniref:sensor histidine kinase n=1 Tax=Jiulongibacter sp. NS-SX5 TaxID=3463854 RepID=UPI0040598656